MTEYTPERVFGSTKGLHIEFRSKEDAQSFYQEALEFGSRVERHAHLVVMLTSKYAASEEDN
ncbi:MAG: hypothetical protein AAFO76_15780 [Cyanobacteria bacterium J06607_15]